MLVVSTFGEKLIGMREAKGFNERRSFSRAYEVSESTLWQIESGRGKPFHLRNDKTRKRIANGVGRDVVELDRESREDSTSSGDKPDSGEGPVSDPPNHSGDSPDANATDFNTEADAIINAIKGLGREMAEKVMTELNAWLARPKDFRRHHQTARMNSTALPTSTESLGKPKQNRPRHKHG